MCRQIKRGMDHKTVPNLPQEYNKTEYTYDYVDNVLTVTTDKSRNLGKLDHNQKSRQRNEENRIAAV